jgi:hypothetical protein
MRLRLAEVFWEEHCLVRYCICNSFIDMATVIKRKSSRKSISKIFNKAVASKGVDTKKYCGVIKLDRDPLVIQKQLRNEWE